MWICDIPFIHWLISMHFNYLHFYTVLNYSFTSSPLCISVCVPVSVCAFLCVCACVRECACVHMCVHVCVCFDQIHPIIFLSPFFFLLSPSFSSRSHHISLPFAVCPTANNQSFFHKYEWRSIYWCMENLPMVEQWLALFMEPLTAYSSQEGTEPPELLPHPHGVLVDSALCR